MIRAAQNTEVHTRGRTARPLFFSEDAATRIKQRNSTITLAGVAVGDRVKVAGRSVAANTVLAKSIGVKSE